jgi:DNA-binding Lrp family transcriptional regulator
MPHELDEIDIAILNSLIEDGRKSFRQIAREIKVTTPTVQARYRRLVNLGFIKSVSPVLDMSKLDKKSKMQIKKSDHKTSSKLNLVTNHDIKVTCDYCEGSVNGKPIVLKFAQFERFFCCSSCKTLYKEKYGGRIRSISSSVDEN